MPESKTPTGVFFHYLKGGMIISFRVILIENGAKVRYKLDNLLVAIKGVETTIPLSDISTLVIDNFDSTISARVLDKMSKYNICLITCDEKHLPTGIYTGLYSHSRATKMQAKQLSQSKDKKDEIWKRIIKSKINNQIGVIEKTTNNSNKISLLKEFYNDVTDGDKTNREGHSAKVYFNELMGKSFSRGDDSLIANSALDYGYTIFRSYLARLCVGYGLNTMIGLFHKNEYNQFNLVDDLIESFRPIVDLFVYNNIAESEFFTYLHRRSLIALLNHKMYYKNKKQHITSIMQQVVYNYSAILDKEDFSSLVFPDIRLYVGE